MKDKKDDNREETVTAVEVKSETARFLGYADGYKTFVIVQPCPQCGNTAPTLVGDSTETVKQNSEIIIEQNASCEQCGTLYLSKVSAPIAKETEKVEGDCILTF